MIKDYFLYLFLYFLLFLSILINHLLESIRVSLLSFLTEFLLYYLSFVIHFTFFALIPIIKAPNHVRLGHKLLHFLCEIFLSFILNSIKLLNCHLSKLAFTMYNYDNFVTSSMVMSLLVWIEHSASRSFHAKS